MLFVWPGYRTYTRRLSFLGLAVGILGAVAWIALSTWQRNWMPLLADKTGIEWFKTLGQRSAFNPLDELRAQPALAYAFLAVRLIGLAIVVPIIEEFFPPRIPDALRHGRALVGSSFRQRHSAWQSSSVPASLS